MRTSAKILFLIIILPCSFVFAKNYSIELSKSNQLILPSKNWVKGKGNFVPGSTSMNIFSHKSKKEHQVFYEDLFIPRLALKDRLPKDCHTLIDDNSSQKICVVNNAVEGDVHSASITTLFSVSKANIVKVRTVYISGKKADVWAFTHKFFNDQRIPASNKKGAK